MTQKAILLIASALGALSVMIGAFGAHALAPMLRATNRVETFETAVKYQMYHTLALLAVGLLLFKVEHPALQIAAWAFLIGIIIFSGSLYTLILTGVTWMGAITPIGGTAMIVGWAALFYAILKAL
ncbi:MULTISPECIES: DUF423 domain-containing protein [Pontibacter]|uniref:Uncharacterized membrane protein YgdD (TMEM256/DUF423 family) n=2 Tax=Pontibacter TaxID=323449 RepID=A0A2U1B138_9BACT|nr:DUF423 domain-containing protein [Pontibacter amylolyticus]PVY42400.1 uncharacterized membrane protein YgdD (TMEM256/DUF423 family) [Pontibacter virosus]GGG14217.1 membrane protein [Pontibacter amylolyticus]